MDASSSWWLFGDVDGPEGGRFDFARTVALAVTIVSVVGHADTKASNSESRSRERLSSESVNHVVRLRQLTGEYFKNFAVHSVYSVGSPPSPYTNRVCLSMASTGLRVRPVRINSAVLIE